MSSRLVAPSATTAFSCEEFSNGRSYLRADYAVECGTDSHRRVRDVAWLGIFLYPVGVSLFYAVFLLAARRALVEDKPTALSKALALTLALALALTLTLTLTRILTRT